MVAYTGVDLEREISRLCSCIYEPEGEEAGPSHPGNNKLFDTIRAVVAERSADRPTARALLDGYEKVRDARRRDVRWRDATALTAAAALEMAGCTIDAVDRVVLTKGDPCGAPSIDVLSDEASTMLAVSCAAIRSIRALLRIDTKLAALALAQLTHRPPLLGRILPHAGRNRTASAILGDHRVRRAASLAITDVAERVGRGIGTMGNGRVCVSNCSRDNTHDDSTTG